jgi:hypothetical protein|nr:MAG TPA: hypothetical protein [Caudoviricetes sp.]
MNKIIFEFSETGHDDITITIDATHAEVIFAATILIDRLAANMRKETKVSKREAIEQVLAAAKKSLENAQKEQEADNKQWEISNE